MNKVLAPSRALRGSAAMPIPRLSHKDIELKAEEVLEYFEPSILIMPAATPLMSIVEGLKAKFGILYDFDSDLGKTPKGHKILGLFSFKPRAILVDGVLKGTAKFAFTLAHEIGHLVLHRKIHLADTNYNEIRDTKREFVTGKKILSTDREWMEWQANKFASAFLVPRSTAVTALCSVQEKMGIVRDIGSVYLDDSETNRRDFNILLLHMSAIYGTSAAVIENRLSDLGLCVDRRGKDVRHIADLLREG